jgi:hypothetical protein
MLSHGLVAFPRAFAFHTKVTAQPRPQSSG